MLVNQLSASACEIVAGAVKNLDRGVVIGETTFGKGSVQMLFDIPSPVSTSAKGDDDRLGLKLTTAQYLTPGDLSIQGVGVTPDVELVRLRVQKTTDESIIQLQRSTHRRQESDYEWHLDHPSAQKGTKPAETLSYLFVPSAAQEKREQAAAKEDDDDEDAQDQEQEEEEEDLEALEENIDRLPDGVRPGPAGQHQGRPPPRDAAGGEELPGQGRAPRRTRSCRRRWRSWASTGPRVRPTRPPARCR